MSRKKRSLIFSVAYHPHIGGAEVAIEEITARLSEGYTFDVVTAQMGDDTRKETIDGVTVYRVGSYKLGFLNRLLYPFLATIKATGLSRKNKYDFVWVMMAAYAGLAGVLFSYVKPKIPYVLSLQEGDPIEFIEGRMKIIWPLFTRMFTRAEAVQAISTFLGKWALKRHGKNVSVIPNGVNLSRFTSGDKRKARKQLGLKEQGNIIVTTSRLVKKNGIDLVIRALPMVPDALFVVAGDGPLRNELESLAKKQKVQDRVMFLGSVPFQKIQTVVQAGDVFVRPSRSEGMGNSFIEAMAMRVPVIGTPVGGIPDFLIDAQENPTEGTGLVVPPEDVPALARALNKMLSDTSLMSATTSRAYTFVKEHYNWDMLSEKMDSVFKSTIKSGKRPWVLIATGLYPPEGGGPATYSKTLVEELPKHGFKVDVLPFRKVRAFPKVVRHIVYSFLVLKKMPETDIVYAQDPLSVGLPSMIPAKLFGKAFVVKVVGDYAWEQARQRFGYEDTLENFQTDDLGFVASTMRSLERMVARQASEVVVPSKYLGGIVKKWGVKKPHVIYNGVSLPKVGLKQVIRGLLKFRGELVVSPGRLVPWKGFKTMIDIHADLKKKRPHLHLLIAGGGPDQESLEAYAKKKGVDDSVIFSGNVDNAVLLRYMRASDVLALNTHYEGFSHVLLEAASIGIPIVTTNIGGNPELIDHGKNGYLVKPDDTKAFKKHITELLDSPELRAKVTTSAKRRATSLSVEKMVDGTADALKNVL